MNLFFFNIMVCVFCGCVETKIHDNHILCDIGHVPNIHSCRCCICRYNQMKETEEFLFKYEDKEDTMCSVCVNEEYEIIIVIGDNMKYKLCKNDINIFLKYLILTNKITIYKEPINIYKNPFAETSDITICDSELLFDDYGS